MTTDDVESTKLHLTKLNVRIGEMEQTRGEEAIRFFTERLSNDLIFRRASGKVDNKEAFVNGLNEPGAFQSRRSEDIAINLLDDRALVTLVVIGTLVKDGEAHRYRNVRLFVPSANRWVLELWYNYEIPR